MADLIDRQAAIEILATMQGLCTSKAALLHNSKIWQQIKDLPSVDAVEVVRCGECRHYEKFGWCKLNDVVMQSKDFCNYGERKDERLNQQGNGD